MARRTTKLTHVSSTGQVRMVDVGDKTVSRREAIAVGHRPHISRSDGQSEGGANRQG